MKKNKTQNQQYSWLKDKKLFGLMLIMITVSFQIFAFLEIPVMTTIHGYTIGMLFGFYNPLFYLFIGYIGLLLMTNNKIRLPKWFQLKWTTYWFIAISIVFIAASSGYYQTKNGWLVIGKDSWLAFPKWFNDFTAKDNAWIPVNTNGGVIGVFLYSVFATFTSGIGAFVIAILSILVPLSLLFNGSAWGLYRKILRKKILTKRQKNLIVKQTEINETIDIESSIDNLKPASSSFEQEGSHSFTTATKTKNTLKSSDLNSQDASLNQTANVQTGSDDYDDLDADISNMFSDSNQAFSDSNHSLKSSDESIANTTELEDQIISTNESVIDEYFE